MRAHICNVTIGRRNSHRRGARKSKTRREGYSRRAVSFKFDPVLVTSWSPSHRGRASLTISLDGCFLDVVQPWKMIREIFIALSLNLRRIRTLSHRRHV